MDALNEKTEGRTLKTDCCMLTEETRTKIEAELRRFPQRRTALLPSLKLAQEQIGWLPPDAIAEVADVVGVSHASANELATFYSMLRTVPGGSARVEVCVQLPCALRGAERLLADLAAGLGVQPGEISADGRVELIRTSECFGSCHRAPMCRINDVYHEHLSPDATRSLIAELRGRASAEGVPRPGNAREEAVRESPLRHAP
jgi:NADH-quinone oxidoreductase subunit E